MCQCGQIDFIRNVYGFILIGMALKLIGSVWGYVVF